MLVIIAARAGDVLGIKRALALPGKRDLANADLKAARAINPMIDAYMAALKIVPPAGM